MHTIFNFYFSPFQFHAHFKIKVVKSLCRLRHCQLVFAIASVLCKCNLYFSSLSCFLLYCFYIVNNFSVSVSLSISIFALRCVNVCALSTEQTFVFQLLTFSLPPPLSPPHSTFPMQIAFKFAYTMSIYMIISPRIRQMFSMKSTII